ncbi:2Fe-2S iron-sulfur cluster-binding protein [Calidifontibacillus erzurumensis]|uniref:(2Fe-2S)-binding protein n=1 Tax=Calidifontibacillus erzurumensis TaxID=2741433 RepID=A0A8J8KFN1_9BACI|nr:2Fe-2S iron-sulfur cluster-binding protein [Calidifontibacillus erzurumensis]NSL53095.1 (2Fe-2S)-binding protein [Calidifontibacillus erzurumensis]
MPKVILHVDGEKIEKEVKENANLVVLAGTKQFPKLKYGCGMGKCLKCVCEVLSGWEQLGPPNWKEEKMLGESVNERIRLTCQLTIKEDIEISQENILAKIKKEKNAVKLTK